MKNYILLTFFCLSVHLLSAQETTGRITGKIVDKLEESVVYATVLLRNVDTNERNVAYSNDNGTFRFLNISPSNYVIEISFLGYEDYKSETIQVKLGQETEHDVMLAPSSIELEEIVVSDARGISEGGSSRVSSQRIGETPTLFRSVQELTRANPENNLNSFQGASHRFNNLNIDGVATNDIIGFQEPASGASGSQANGTPGSLSKSQPIGFGAIKELSVKTTPFDVSIGNFNGANIDIVTKNGTNKFEHSIFGFGNNQVTTGQKIGEEDIEVANFSDYQVGLNSGGPIVKDKFFYFLNFEYTKATNPLINNPGSPGSSISFEDATAVRDRLLEEFDYDPGAFQSASNTIQSSKIFARIDYILNDQHKLTFRNNYVNSFADNLEWSNTIFNFGNQGYRHNNSTNSAVVELKSNFKKVYNKLNISFNNVKEGRTFDGRIFPHIQIATSSASRIFAGTYREASVFNSEFSTFQLLDKVSVVKGDHSISGGFLVQLHDIDYGFLSAWNGRWEYSSVENFLNDRPSRIRGVYNVTPENNNFDFVQNNPAASIAVLESALYLQDRWDVTSDLSLTYGVRLDGQFLTKDLPVSPLISGSEDFSDYTNELTNNYQFNPRASFNYSFGDSGWSLSGGTGLFSGRLPYLWFAYIDYISGTDYFNIDIRPDGEFALTEDLGDLVSLQPGITEINLLDPEFKYPRDWKSNIGVAWQTENDWDLGLEFSYTNVVQGLLFQTINRNEVFNTFQGADNRVFYDTSGEDVKIDQNFTNVFVLSNTNGGFRYNATFKAEKKYTLGNTYLGYSYGVSKDVSSTVRSSPAANYEWNQAIFGNDPELAFSNFDLRHKINFLQSLVLPIGERSLMVSLLYNGRSGSPYTFVYQGDLNRDGSSRNDLVYIPADQSEIELVDIVQSDGSILSADAQWSALDNYINDLGYLRDKRGDYAVRNESKTPWNHSLDANLKYKFTYFKGKKATVSADIFNVLNMISPSWGKQYFVPNVVNSSFSLLRFEGISEGNVPQYSFNIPLDQKPWIVDTFSSRWRIQLGVKVDF